MVGAEGFEPPALCSQSRCATRLRYAPTLNKDTVFSRVFRRHNHCYLSMGHSGDYEDTDQLRHEYHRNHSQGQHKDCQTAEEQPVTTRTSRILVKTAGKQFIVPPVRLPRDIKNIADKWNDADDHFNADIGYHPGDRDRRNSAKPGRQNDDARGQAAKNIADSRHHADDAVDAKAERRAWNAKPVVEHMRQQIEIFIVKEACPSFTAWREYLGSGPWFSCLHRLPPVYISMSRTLLGEMPQ